MALFLMVLLSVAGLAFLSVQTAQRDAAKSSRLAEQARQLAVSGLEDARYKLTTNFRVFRDMREQKSFSYVETVGPPGWGNFEVTVDLSQAGRPHFLVMVTSTGRAGGSNRPEASRTLRVELDIAKEQRDGSGNPNPNLFQVLWSRDDNEGFR